MTLIVGIKCESGVVLGADGVATRVDSDRRSTVQLSVKQKIRVVASKVIAVGVAGEGGLGRRIQDEFDITHNVDQLASQSTFLGFHSIRDVVMAQVRKEWSIAAEAERVYGDTVRDDVGVDVLAAAVIGGEANLVHVNRRGGGATVDDDVPWITLGSGQVTADPFLAFLRRIFWPDRVPTLSEGRLGAVWTLDHSIHVNRRVVGGEIQVVVLEKQGETWATRELQKREIDLHRLNIADAERVFAEYGHRLAATVTPPPSPPPGQSK
jgi:hypothetical protein